MTPSAHSTAWDRVWLGVHLATMHGASLGVLRNAALAVADGRIAWLGNREALAGMQWSATTVTDAPDLWITPGLIDCHTHLVYAGDRSNEFAARLRGQSYEDIARAGGGILATMRATRAATEDGLLEESLPRARALAAEGVTTVEIKSGYGLDLDSELKMLRVARRIGDTLGIEVVPTFLGAHALPPEYAGRQEDYVRHLCDDMLPAVARAGLAKAVDAYCERIAFTPAQTGRVFTRARELGLAVRLHADQLSDGGGGRLAAQHGALSADHIEHTSADSLQAMAEAGVVAGLLPGAFYFLRETRLPPIERLRALNVPMAVATDCNPGTSPLASLLTAMNMACVLFRLTAEETWLGVTRHAARALGLEGDRGVLAVGMRADLAVWRVRHPEQICAQLGVHRPIEVLAGGERIAAGAADGLGRRAGC